MDNMIYQRMRENPRFHDLVARRSRFAWTLAAIVLFLFYGFVMLVAFSPATLATPLQAGSRVTFGIALELFMFIFFWLLTALYVWRANKSFDAEIESIIESAWEDKADA